VVHGGIAAGFLGAIAYVWWCALTGRRDHGLNGAVAALVAEGAVVAANHGDCPLGPLQERAGDPVPLFELVLSPNAARRAIPILGVVAATGIALVTVRGQGRARSACAAPRSSAMARMSAPVHALTGSAARGS
jgi:hypothetical protein